MYLFNSIIACFGYTKRFIQNQMGLEVSGISHNMNYYIMDQLVTKEKLHFFMPDLAAKYGHNEAIILNHLIYWIAHNSINGKNRHDERFWTFNPVRKIAEQYPYYSESQVGRYIKSLIKQGVIVTGNYNKHPYDQTKWYALKEEELFLTTKYML